MVLLQTAQGAITQRFGHSALRIEPEMWASEERAYWLPVPGTNLVHDDDCHPGLDVANDQGTPLRAQERGRVVFAGWRDSISGFQYEVQVNPLFRYSANHLMGFAVTTGQTVKKGQLLGFMGATGAATGPHAHLGNSLYLPGPDGVHRTFLYDPELFTAGGKYADDERIQPEQRLVALNGVGINLLLAPPHEPIGGIYARSMDPPGPAKPGIYRKGTGNRLGPVGQPMELLYWRKTQDRGTMAIVHLNGERLAVRDEHVHVI